jgi:hypothetical protein
VQAPWLGSPRLVTDWYSLTSLRISAGLASMRAIMSKKATIAGTNELKSNILKTRVCLVLLMSF